MIYSRLFLFLSKTLWPERIFWYDFHVLWIFRVFVCTLCSYNAFYILHFFAFHSQVFAISFLFYLSISFLVSEAHYLFKFSLWTFIRIFCSTNGLLLEDQAPMPLRQPVRKKEQITINYRMDVNFFNLFL